MGVSRSDRGNGCGAYILNGAIGHQTRTENLADFHDGGDDDGVGLIRGGIELEARALGSLADDEGVRVAGQNAVRGRRAWTGRRR